MIVAEMVVYLLAAKRAQRACPHCRAGDPFFDTEHREHVIRTEAGCGVTACLANDGGSEHG
jgi:hypothetical protein